MTQLVQACRANNVTDLIIVHEHRGDPGTLRALEKGRCHLMCVIHMQMVSSYVTFPMDPPPPLTCLRLLCVMTFLMWAPCLRPTLTSSFTTSSQSWDIEWVDDDVIPCQMMSSLVSSKWVDDVVTSNYKHSP